jgi:TonB family protein
METTLFRFFCIISFVLAGISLSAQTADSLGIYSIATVMPAYTGGDEALYEYINQNIKYPKEALEQKKEGTVQMRVVIDENGNVLQTKVMRGVCASLDEEAQRVIASTSGKWQSGKIADKPVKVYKYLRVSFKIDTTSIELPMAAKPKAPISFIGGDEAFYTFIRANIQVPHAVFLHSNFWGQVTASMTFNSLNQITDVTLIEGPFKDLNEEGVRLLKLSQGKWIRTDSSKMNSTVCIIVTIPFNETMVDTNDKNKSFYERFIRTAYNSNPIFKRGYDYLQSGNYSLAIMDFEDCIHKKGNPEAALYGRALCYLNTGNNPAACEDLLNLKMKANMDSYFQEIYYKYCASASSRIGIHPTGWGNKVR